MTDHPRLMISAGEASGDHHAARAIQAMRARGISPVLCGMGGPHLADCGMELVVDCRDMAVVGLVEVLYNWRYLNRQLERLRERMRQDRPDLLILVDYPDFNLKLAHTARELGIPVMFYVSPQVWAWRAGRVRQIGRLVDMMAVLFPFESEIYERAGVPVRHVGHPLVDEIRPSIGVEQAREEFALSADRPVLGLMPGSRRGEIERLLPMMLAAARIIRTRHPDIQLILPVAQTLDAEPLHRAVAQSGLDVRVIDGGRAYDVIQACDALITASGTATLEIALMRKPMVVVYRLHWLTYLVFRFMVSLRHISLVNIVAGRPVVRELLQGEARAERVAEETLRILEDRDYREQIIDGLGSLANRIGEGGAANRTADLILEMLSERSRADCSRETP